MLLFSLPASSQSAPRSLKLHAYLFHSATGQLSKDVLAAGGFDKDLDLTDAKAVLVVVEVRYDPHTSFAEKEQVQLVAVETGNGPLAVDPGVPHHPDRMILNKVSHIGPTEGKGAGYVGFWLEVSGCRTVRLKASLVGMKAAPVTELLGFACGE